MPHTFSVDRFLADKPLAITPSGLEELRAHVAGRIAAFQSCPKDFLANAVEEMSAAIGSRQRTVSRGVGVIPIRGTISQHASGDLSAMLFGGTSTEAVAAALRDFLADDSIGRIVLDIDSPGGSVYGVAELAAEIRKARTQKPIQAVANSVAASAALWIASAASEFYVTPGGSAGSIGVYALHYDVSKAMEREGVTPTLISAGKYKVEGNEYEPLSDEARKYAQERVDETYATFVSDVARGRGVSEATVRSGFGQGRMLSAKAAKAAGMADGIATLEQVMQRTAKATAETVEEPEPLEDQAAETPIDDGARDAGLRTRVARLRLRALDARVPA